MLTITPLFAIFMSQTRSSGSVILYTTFTEQLTYSWQQPAVQWLQNVWAFMKLHNLSLSLFLSFCLNNGSLRMGTSPELMSCQEIHQRPLSLSGSPPLSTLVRMTRICHFFIVIFVEPSVFVWGCNKLEIHIKPITGMYFGGLVCSRT